MIVPMFTSPVSGGLQPRKHLVTKRPHLLLGSHERLKRLDVELRHPGRGHLADPSRAVLRGPHEAERIAELGDHVIRNERRRGDRLLPVARVGQIGVDGPDRRRNVEPRQREAGVRKPVRPCAEQGLMHDGRPRLSARLCGAARDPDANRPDDFEILEPAPAARRLEDLEIIWAVRVGIARSTAEARRQARPTVVHQALLSARAHWLPYAGLTLPRFDIPPAVRAIYPDLAHARDWEQAIAATSFVPDDVIAELCDTFGLVGTAEHCARRIGEMTAAGVTKLYVQAFQTFVGPEQEMRTFRDAVFPRLKAAGYR